VAPTERYLKLIRDGAAESGLAKSYQEWLAGLQACPQNGRGLGEEYYDCPQKYVDWVGGLLLAWLTFTWAIRDRLG